MKRTWMPLAAVLAASLWTASALAQSDEDEDDVLSEILGEETPTVESVVGPTDSADDGEDEGANDALEEILSEEAAEESAAEERRAVEDGDIDDRIGVRSEALLTPDEVETKRRLIKTLQRKNFLKIGRYEVAPSIGFVTNDPFINRYIVGASLGYHPTEVFGFEAQAAFSPDFGQADWKPITEQLVNENKVSPDISKIFWLLNANFQFTPMYGKIAVLGRDIVNFDIFGVFGTGVVQTVDDLDALQAGPEDDRAHRTQTQIHPTVNIGGGFRVIFSKSIAARLEGRSMTYIETINSTTLEFKSNFMLMASASFFFPGMD